MWKVSPIVLSLETLQWGCSIFQLEYDRFLRTPARRLQQTEEFKMWLIRTFLTHFLSEDSRYCSKAGPCCSRTSPITPVVQNNCAWLCSRHQISQTESNIPLPCLLLVLGRGGWLRHCGCYGCPADTLSLAFVVLPSVLGQMHAVTVRQKRGYANTRGEAGHTCLSLGHALVLKKLCSWNSLNVFLEKRQKGWG